MATDTKFMVYYRNWRDAEMYMVNTTITEPNPIRLTDLPHGIDIVTVFGGLPEDAGAADKAEVLKFYTKLKKVYAPEMHKRGVKLLSALFYNDVYNQISDFTTDEEYDTFAQGLVEKYVTRYNLDGLDLDQEFSFTEAEIEQLNKLIKALGKYLGPQSGTDRYLVYDSNNPSSSVLNDTVKPYFNQIVYQQYGLGSSATQKFISINSDITDKAIPGLTFPEELSNNRWYDMQLPYSSSHVKEVADFVRENKLGGMFFYAVDRDGRTYNDDDLSHIKPTSFLWIKTAIAEVKSVTLSDAKTLAQTYLDENKNALQLSDEDVETLTQAIQAAETLYDINHVFLDDDYYASVSPTFDLLLLIQNK